MIKTCGLSLIIGGILLYPPISFAAEKKNVEIDMSVLEELKGYEPPPMFRKDITIPSSAILTAPSTEDLLNYPAKNFHVLTKKHDTEPIKAVKAVKAKNVNPPNPPKLPEPKMVVMPKVEPKPYKLQSPKTMPAVPPVAVEKAELPTVAVAKTTPTALEFNGKDADLSKEKLNELNLTILKDLKDNPAKRIEIMAYAAAEKGKESDAKRLSLSRALSVRQYFIDNGIESNRMDVRAMGNETDVKPMDRVDIKIN